ncbi:hypothetical protein L6164_005733 [Bauhinia variegata]|uniref:Uncharacterized protein n=1 Tax=Bauhinia variegata TaxID=167791 RepID=A0ACB9PSQ3_BAUVA|nr:hypothetical protein L6164_005733 [Bauhinia variegata]
MLCSNSLDTGHLNSLQNQHVFQNNVLLKLYNKPSSPSVFRELVENNSNVFGEETDGKDTEDPQPQVARNDDLGEIYCDGIGDIPFDCVPSRYSLELQDNSIEIFSSNPPRLAKL